MSESHPEGYPTTLGDQAFAKYVEEHTNGAIRIEIFANSVLGGEKQTIEQTQAGIIQFIRVGTNPLSALNDIMNALSMPYLFRDREHMFKVLDGEIGDAMLTSLENEHLLGLSWMDAGFRSFYNARNAIRTPADMAGMRIRVQNSALMMDMVRALGASPTPMDYGEVYTSIQNGVIDGAENNWPSYITSAHYEVAKNFTLNEHMAAPEMIMVNTQTWASFSEEEQQIIREAALYGAQVQRQAWIEAEQRHEQTAINAGNAIVRLTPAERQLFVNALMPLYDNPLYAKYADIIAQIRNVQ
jgi:tripartite ATP-independent transporter DctP family solute receptor